MSVRIVNIGGVEIGEGRRLAVICGPCALESEALALRVAEEVRRITEDVGLPLVFKSSYAKDNRLSPGSYAGPGLTAGLAILARVRKDVGVPVISDVHCREEIAPAAEILDAIQIPAFLCRQTRLVEAAAVTGRPLNIKKGQFMAPDDMARVAAKAVAVGNEQVLLTERGSSFGYHNLVVDMRSLDIMRRSGFPVVFDATHSVQLPGASSGTSGGQPEFVPVLARAACAAGCDALFIETHPDPSTALSDSESMIALADLPAVLEQARDAGEVFRAMTGAESGG